VKFFQFVLIAALAGSPDARSDAIADDPRVRSSLELLEMWVRSQADYDDIPGYSIAIVHDQELVWNGTFGLADRERETPVSPKTTFSICSISKLFTSIAVMQLRDRGAFRLSDPVREILPWFTIEQSYPESSPITVEGLLTHSSGLPRESDFPYWSGPDFQFPSHSEFVDRLGRQSTLYPAATYFQYSNLGTSLAGEIVARKSSEPYHQYMRKYVLDPLGMHDTSSDMPVGKGAEHLATGYSASGRDGTRTKVATFKTGAIAPAAGFTSTADDLAKFASWQFRLLENGGTELLNANTLREMHRVHWEIEEGSPVWMGLGFGVLENRSKRFVWHNGKCPGYESRIVLQTRDKIASIFLSNANWVDTAKFVYGAYHFIAPVLAEVAASPGKGKEPDSGLEKFVGSYLTEPWGDEYGIVARGADLIYIDLRSHSPVDSLTTLKRQSGTVFRRVRDDGALAEKWTFEIGEDGRATGVTMFSQRMRRILR